MVEHGVTDLDDILKDRIAVLKSNRDRAKEALARIKVRPVGISGASKPGATTTKVPCRPRAGHALFDGPPPVSCLFRTLNIKTTASGSVRTLMLPDGSPPHVHE